MPSPRGIDTQHIAQRAARELTPGEVTAVGPGLPGLIPPLLTPDSGIIFLADSGAVGYGSFEASAFPPTTDSPGRGILLSPCGTFLSTVDLAGMVRAGYVDTAVLEAGQVAQNGSFCHASSAAAPGLLAPGTSVELAHGARRLILLTPHTAEDGQPTIVPQSSKPLDGFARQGLIITDLAVLHIGPEGLTLTEVAPGWKIDDVVSLTGAPVQVASGVTEMRFDLPDPRPVTKVYPSGLDAVRDMPDGSTVMIDGFAGPGGMPHYLMVALRDHGARELTMVSNTAGIARVVGFGTPPGRQAIDHSILIENGQIRKAIASYPVSPSPARPSAFELAWQQGEVEIEVVPQGTLAERIRAAGAGVAAFYTPTGAGTLLAEGKQTRIIGGKEYVLERALKADYCLIRGYKADTLGNVVYKGTSRNFNAVMAPAATVTVIEVDEIVQPGELDPEAIVTPGVYIDRVVQRPPGFSPYE